ncbi:hypothetical protein ILYODFUR_024928 [Ilyodon furcidens]|uniref:Uncharacterized protein n=1 Tax=Ilyodon furcidens TaxID=33524 RepID=A0ABV0U9Y4_9TELE
MCVTMKWGSCGNPDVECGTCMFVCVRGVLFYNAKTTQRLTATAATDTEFYILVTTANSSAALHICPPQSEDCSFSLCKNISLFLSWLALISTQPGAGRIRTRRRLWTLHVLLNVLL